MAFGTAETAKLLVDLSLTGNYQAGLSKAQKGFNNLGRSITDTQGRAYKAGQQIGTGIKRGVFLAVGAIGTLTAALAFAVKQGQEAANVQKIFATAVTNSFKTAADQSKTLKDRIGKFQKALANTKPGSKAAQNLAAEIKQLKAQLANIGAITPAYVQALNDQQKALMNLAGVDDELIKSEQTRLIQMGLSGKATLKLTPLILDAAKATGKDLLTVTIAAGKAANGNATALGRLGIVVDKTRFKVDPLAETIRVLNQRFGGTTKALSGSFDVRLAALRENLNNIAEDAGQKLLPALTRIVSVVGTKVVPALGKMVDRILPEITKGLDEFAAALENGAAEDAIRGITDALGPLVDLVKIAAAPVKAIVGAFLALPKEVQTVLVGAFAVNKLTGGLVTNAAGGLVQAIGKAFLGGIKAPVVNVEGAVVNVGGGGADVIGKVIGGSTATAIGGLTASVLGVVLPIAIGTALGEASRQAFANMPSHQRQISLRQETAATGRRQGFGTGPLQPTSPAKATDPLVGKKVDDLRMVQERAFKSLAGKIADDKITTVNALNRGFASTGKQIDDRIAPRINPKLTDLERRTDSGASKVAGAIARKDLSIDQSIQIKVNVSAAGVTKSVTIQNRAGPGNGSAGTSTSMSGGYLGGAR